MALRAKPTDGRRTPRKKKAPGTPIVDDSTSAYDLIIGEYFRDWRQNRTDLEKAWEANRLAFLAMSADKWKPGEAKGWRSDSVIRYLRRKVMYAYCLALDGMMGNGRIPFGLEIPDYQQQA